MHNKYIKNAFNNIKKEKLLSITNIIVMGITFLLLGVFLSVVVLTQTVLRDFERQAQVTIFFKDEIPENKILEIETKLKSDERIFATNYISKEEAFNIFKELNKDDPVLLESVTSSILPASLEVQAKDLSSLPRLAEEFKGLDGVEEVRFFEDVISRFKKFSTVVYSIGFVLVFLFLVISYAVVLSTLRMTINSKGVELEIIKLVGARNSYVKMPLMYQGLFYGFISSLISGFILFVIIIVLSKLGNFPASFGVGFFPNLSISHFVFAILLWLILIISGCVLGYFGSLFAVKKYLKY
ncbi:hypothetical protein A2V49_02750 [candidate division WWE3 bacterium RBG_19FT_COMBO_34_6]|uniref:Cell division protein FtsX n=1 Tax=candidate division WWE3 bacterium RBG_19FT_COMBO_34_6 TaxID=1802612 RepID=A0A1F4UN89_UNCKA|nr:MAG: hypothetical protein A2V49_02750 [candidate division WWE3 bacterium RBG_19FT_COMBO_34_6]